MNARSHPRPHPRPRTTGGAPGSDLVLTYPERGATRREPLPEGYHHLRRTEWVGHGRAAFETAGTRVMTWAAHRATRARVAATAGRAGAGVRVRVSLGAGPLRMAAPCEVLWTVEEADRTGFAYGTLTGHPECGEESFLVELRGDGSVWFTVTAFSRPAAWYTRLAGPVIPVAQRCYAGLLARALRRACADTGTGAGAG